MLAFESASLFALVALFQLTPGDTVRLSPPLAPNAGAGTVSDYDITPDGSMAVYVANQEQLPRFELFSVPLAGGESKKLNVELEYGADISKFALSPDGDRVAYFATPAGETRTRLFVTTLDGETTFDFDPHVSFDSTLTFASDESIVFSGDGSRLFFHAIDGGVARLFWVDPRFGGPLHELFGPAPGPEVSISGLTVDEDGSHAVFRAKGGPQPPFSGFEVYGVAPDRSSTAVVLVPSSGSSSQPFGYEFTPDGSRVVFFLDGHVWSAIPGQAGSAVQIAPSSAFGAPAAFEISPDSTEVFFSTASGVARVPIDASGPATQFVQKLLVTPSLIALSPDGSRLAFTNKGGGAPLQKLRSVETTGSNPPPFLYASETIYQSVQITPDGGRVVATTVEGPNAHSVVSVPVDGSALTSKIGDVSGFWKSMPLVSPDSRWAAWIEPYSSEVRITSLDGTTPERTVHTPFPKDAVGASKLRFSPDGSRIYFLADLATAERVELFSTSTEAPNDTVRHSPPLDPLGGVRIDQAGLTPDGKHVFFICATGGFSDYSGTLYSAPVDGSSPAVLVAGPFATNVLREVIFSPDSKLAAVSTFDGTQAKLCLGPIDGSRPYAPVAPTFAGASFPFFAHDSSAVVFSGTESASGENSIYSVPVDLSVAPVDLVPGAAGSYGARLLAVAPDNTVVVASPDANASWSVLATAVGGTRPVTSLAGPFPPNTFVDTTVFVFETFKQSYPGERWPSAVAPDSSRLLFVAFDFYAPDYRAFIVPLDGSAAPFLLNPKLPTESTHRFSRVTLTPDWSRVVYVGESGLRSSRTDRPSRPVPLPSPGDINGQLHRAIVSADGRRAAIATASFIGFYSLSWSVGLTHVAPLDGDGPTVVVPGSTGQPFGDFAPSGERFVFAQDGALFSASLLPNGEVLRLSPVVAGESVVEESWAASADGERVYYVADHGEPGVMRLFVAGITEPSDGTWIAGTADDYGDVQPDLLVTPDGQFVLYALDAEVDDGFELFSLRVAPPPAASDVDAGN